jgi:hypothetical protein
MSRTKAIPSECMQDAYPRWMLLTRFSVTPHNSNAHNLTTVISPCSTCCLLLCERERSSKRTTSLHWYSLSAFALNNHSMRWKLKQSSESINFKVNQTISSTCLRLVHDQNSQLDALTCRFIFGTGCKRKCAMGDCKAVISLACGPLHLD